MKRKGPRRGGFFQETKWVGRETYRELRRPEFRRGFRRDLSDLYEFYVDEETRERLQRMSRFRRWLWQAGWLLRSLIEFLAPERRVILVVALVLFVLGRPDQAQDSSWELPLAVVLLLIVLMLELKDKLLARDELELGRSIQLSLLPDHDPQLQGWEIWLFSTPANDVGGDLVDYLEVEPGRLAVVLGDVAGKGLGAALLMSKLQATLRALLTPSSTAAEAVARLNRIFCRDGVDGRFATLVELELRAGEGKARLVNAGHPPPLWVRAEGVERPDPMSLPVGVDADERYVEQELDLTEDDLLVVYSDGVSESTDEGGEFFGDARVRELVQGARGRRAAEVGEEILRAVESFRGAGGIDDDLSLVIARRSGRARSGA